MTIDEARRLLERTTDFEFRQGQVVVRNVRTLASIETLRREVALDAWLADQPVVARPTARAA